jgi:hypothetical protein
MLYKQTACPCHKLNSGELIMRIPSQEVQENRFNRVNPICCQFLSITLVQYYFIL